MKRLGIKISAGRVARNTAILIALRVLLPACGLLLVLSLSRHLGAEGLGRYSLVFGFLYFFNNVAPLGLASVITRDGAKNRDAIQPTLANALALSSVGSIALAGIMAALGPLLNYDKETQLCLALTSLALLPFTIGTLFEGAFLALQKMQHVAAAMVLEYVIKVGGAIILLYLGLGLYAVLAMAILGRSLACLLGAHLLAKEGIRVRWAPEPELMKHLARLAPTFVLINVFASLYWRVDLLMLSKMQPLVEVGYYSASYRVFDMAMVIPYSLCLALYPNIASVIHSDAAALRTLGRTVMRYLTALTLPAAVCTSVFSRQVLELLYGPGFGSAAPTLAVLMWTLVFYGLVRYHAFVLLAANRQRVDLVLNAAMLLVNVALNYFLIPRYSHLGAALATLSAILAYGTLQYWYLARYLRGYAAPIIIPPVVPIASLAVGALVLWMQNMSALLVVPAAIAVYILILLGGGFFTREELALIRVGRIFSVSGPPAE